MRCLALSIRTAALKRGGIGTKRVGPGEDGGLLHLYYYSFSTSPLPREDAGSVSGKRSVRTPLDAPLIHVSFGNDVFAVEKFAVFIAAFTKHLLRDLLV